MYRHVVVPLDGSERAKVAMGPAADLAWRCDADLVVVHSVDVLDEPLSEATLRERADSLGLDEVEVVIDDRRPAAEAVAAVVDARGDAVVCMATHGHGATERVVGTVAEAVLRRTAAPALLVGPRYEGGHRLGAGPVIACIDGSRLSEAVVPLAARWATLVDAGLWVVSVVDPAGVAAAARAAPGGDLDEASHVHRMADAARPIVEGRVDWEVLHGRHPAAELLEFAEHHPGALLAVATHGRSGLSRVAMGSVAMSVVHGAREPVLVTKVDG